MFFCVFFERFLVVLLQLLDSNGGKSSLGRDIFPKSPPNQKKRETNHKFLGFLAKTQIPYHRKTTKLKHPEKNIFQTIKKNISKTLKKHKQNHN